MAPLKQKLLGLDFGRKKIGVARSDGSLSTPITSYNSKEALARIGQLIKAEEIDIVVIGLLPGVLEHEIRGFAQKIKQTSPVRVVFVDETLTSRQAQTHTLSAKHDEHAHAAALILDNYIEENTHS